MSRALSLQCDCWLFFSFFNISLDFSREHQVISSIEPKFTKNKSNYTNFQCFFLAFTVRLSRCYIGILVKDIIQSPDILLTK